MTEYEFTLRFALPSNEDPSDDLVERLAVAGCDDALVGIGMRGRLAMDFSRRATSAREAVFGAIADVREAIPDAQIAEVSPDLVGVTDIADLMGCSRQNIRRMLVTSRSSSPPPLHEGNPSIWHLAHVLHWLVSEKRYCVNPQLIALAELTMSVNAAIDALNTDSATQAEIHALRA